jgi:hypothetical protein
MRNLVEYPVTADETITLVRTLLGRAQQSKAIGSMHPLILSYVLQYLTENKLSLIDFLEKKQPD